MTLVCVSNWFTHIIASQMWLLGRLLPVMIGESVPGDDTHWICFIDLLRILCISSAFEITEDAISVLTLLIENYLFQYNHLYPNSITPKCHILLHLPDQIRR